MRPVGPMAEDEHLNLAQSMTTRTYHFFNLSLVPRRHRNHPPDVVRMAPYRMDGIAAEQANEVHPEYAGIIAKDDFAPHLAGYYDVLTRVDRRCHFASLSNPEFHLLQKVEPDFRHSLS